LIGAEPLCGHYADALALSSETPQIHDNDAMTISGLIAIAGQTQGHSE